MIDLAVAGGGPVGLISALYAARAGLSVRVHEPRPGVVDKACGEGLMPGALAQLQQLGIEPAGQPLRGIRYLASGRRADAPFRHGTGRGVRRTTLHRTLLEVVRDAGVDIVERPVTDLSQRNGHVDFAGGRAAYVIAADGLHSSLRRELGLHRGVATPRRYGLRVHARVPAWTDFVEVSWSADAESYVTPVEPELVNVALLSSRRLPFTGLLQGFPDLQKRLANAPLTQVRGAGPLRQSASRPLTGRVLLVGDASGYVDALTGEGMAVGFAQARAAVAAVADDAPATYAREWRRITWRHRLLTLGLLTATRPAWGRRTVVPAAERLPRVFAGIVNELARPA